MDRQRRKQAEFLVYRFCPREVINLIGALNETVKRRIERILARHEVSMPVEVHGQWYY